MTKKKKYLKGGKLKGKPHSKGGIPIEVEGGEYIIKKSSVNKETEPVLESINKTGNISYENGGKIMPTVKDEQGNVIAKLPYTDQGELQAEKMVSANPGFEIDYAPGGEVDAPGMREQLYAGGGKTGYSKIGMYKKGGKVKK